VVAVELARHNARIYGVEDMIEFVVGDFFRLAPSLKVRSVLLDEYIQKRHALCY
jgi:trimethylguanosine synthase